MTDNQPQYKWRITWPDEGDADSWKTDFMGWDGDTPVGRIRLETAGPKKGKWQWSGLVQREIHRSKIKFKMIAEKGGVCASTVGRMAAGETQHPRAETVFAMLRVLGFEVVVRS